MFLHEQLLVARSRVIGLDLIHVQALETMAHYCASISADRQALPEFAVVLAETLSGLIQKGTLRLVPAAPLLRSAVIVGQDYGLGPTDGLPVVVSLTNQAPLLVADRREFDKLSSAMAGVPELDIRLLDSSA